MKSQGFHSIANQKLPVYTLVGDYFPAVYRRFSIQIIAFYPLMMFQDSVISPPFSEEKKGDKGWLLLFLQKRMTCSGGGY